MDDMNIFMIGTAHQYHQVEIAVRQFCLDKNDVYLLVEDLGFENAFQEGLSDAGFGEVIFFKSWRFEDLVLKPKLSKQFIATCRSLRFRFRRINLYTSHYDSDFCLLADSILKPKKFVLMDEGTASFETAIARRSNRGNNLKLFIKSILYNVPISLPRKIIFFTKYNLKISFPDEVSLYCEAKIDNPVVSKNKDVVVFLGASIVEVGLLAANHYHELLIKYNYFRTSK